MDGMSATQVGWTVVVVFAVVLLVWKFRKPLMGKVKGLLGGGKAGDEPPKRPH